MNPNTFQEALKATARIACCAGQHRGLPYRALKDTDDSFRALVTPHRHLMIRHLMIRHFMTPQIQTDDPITGQTQLISKTVHGGD